MSLQKCSFGQYFCKSLSNKSHYFIYIAVLPTNHIVMYYQQCIEKLNLTKNSSSKIISTIMFSIFSEFTFQFKLFALSNETHQTLNLYELCQKLKYKQHVRPHLGEVFCLIQYVVQKREFTKQFYSTVIISRL